MEQSTTFKEQEKRDPALNIISTFFHKMLMMSQVNYQAS